MKDTSGLPFTCSSSIDRQILLLHLIWLVSGEGDYTASFLSSDLLPMMKILNPCGCPAQVDREDQGFLALWSSGSGSFPQQLPQLPAAAPTFHVGTVLDIAQTPKSKSEILGSAVAQGCGSRSQGLNGHTVDVKEGLGAPCQVSCRQQTRRPWRIHVLKSVTLLTIP